MSLKVSTSTPSAHTLLLFSSPHRPLPAFVAVFTVVCGPQRAIGRPSSSTSSPLTWSMPGFAPKRLATADGVSAGRSFTKGWETHQHLEHLFDPRPLLALRRPRLALARHPDRRRRALWALRPDLVGIALQTLAQTAATSLAQALPREPTSTMIGTVQPPARGSMSARCLWR